MATTYYHKNTTALSPCPTDMVGTPTASWEGTYTSCKDASTTIGTGTGNTIVPSYITATDNAQHSIKITNWLSPALEAQSIASQTWTVKLRPFLNAALAFAKAYAYVELYVWNGTLNNKRATIGSRNFVEITNTAPAQSYTINIVGAATISEGDRIGCDVWLEVDDDVNETNSPMTCTFRYNGATNDSNFTSPATITELATFFGRRMMGLGT